MNITIQDTPQEVLLTTVVLTIDKREPDKTIQFHCYFCGTGGDQIRGNISNLVPHLVPTDGPVVIRRCMKCKENYTYRSLKYFDSGTTKLTLIAHPGVNTFHCLICRTQLMQYNATIVKLLPDIRNIEMGEMFSCFKPDCNHKYQLTDIVI